MRYYGYRSYPFVPFIVICFALYIFFWYFAILFTIQLICLACGLASGLFSLICRNYDSIRNVLYPVKLEVWLYKRNLEKIRREEEKNK